MSDLADVLSADDILPLAKKLSRGEQVRLARSLLEAEEGDDLLARRRAGMGRYAGRGWIAEDFDELPPEFQRYFDGEGDPGVKLLLDTHGWLWLALDPVRVAANVRDQVVGTETEVYVSTVTLWEVVIKTGLGKLKLPDPVEVFWRR